MSWGVQRANSKVYLNLFSWKKKTTLISDKKKAPHKSLSIISTTRIYKKFHYFLNGSNPTLLSIRWALTLVPVVTGTFDSKLVMLMQADSPLPDIFPVYPR